MWQSAVSGGSDVKCLAFGKTGKLRVEGTASVINPLAPELDV
jgi:hypothetical protein